MKKKVLIVVDMQEDFVSGSLGTKEAQAIVPRVAEKPPILMERSFSPSIPMGLITSKRRKAGSFLCRIASKERLVIALCRNWRIWRNGLARKKWKRKLLAPLLLLESLKSAGYHRERRTCGPLHGYLRCFQCPDHQGSPARSARPCRQSLLRWGYASFP